MADPRLLTAHDFIVPLDYGQFWLSSCSCMEEDYALDVRPEADPAEIADLDYNQDVGIWQIPVEYGDSGMIIVLSPHQLDHEMPLRVEVWDGPPPDDTADWPEAFEAHLEVDPHGLVYNSPDMGAAIWLGVPPGAYHALITGRGFVARGNPRSLTPGDSWRIRVWPSASPRKARRLSMWHAPAQ